VPSEDNPLAEGLPDGEGSDDLLTEGKRAERSGGEESDGPSDDGNQDDD
jgi:hypothetical protein